MLVLHAEYAATRIPRGNARIVRGFCEFAVRITIVRNSAPFRAICSADLRVKHSGKTRGADPGARRGMRVSRIWARQTRQGRGFCSARARQTRQEQAVGGCYLHWRALVWSVFKITFIYIYVCVCVCVCALYTWVADIGHLRSYISMYMRIGIAPACTRHRNQVGARQCAAGRGKARKGAAARNTRVFPRI